MNILLFDFNNVLKDVALELRNRGHILLPIDGKKATAKKADVVVTWQETELGGWRDWIKDIKKRGKRTVLVQHGRRGTSRIFPPFNEELISDVVCCWGPNDKKRLESCGVSPERIKVTGTPVTNYVKPRIPHEGINIVFSPEHWDVDVVENAIIASALRKIKGVKIITKCLTGEHENIYDNPVYSDRKEDGHLEKCIEVLQTADVVVAVSESTFELLAEIMGIPVVIIDIWIPKACNGDERYKEYHREYSDACTRIFDINELEETIRQELKNPGRKGLDRMRIAQNDGGVGVEDPVKNICDIIENK